jgi:polyhydroxybutyrate depolymerase
MRRLCGLVIGSMGLAAAACGSNDGEAEDADVETAAEAEADGAADEAPGEGDADSLPDESPAEADGEAVGDVPAGCPRPGDPGPGDHVFEMDHGGLVRPWRAHVPPGYDPASPTAMILNLHGLGSNGAQEALFSNMNATADARGFVVVYPDGYENSWNAGACCDPAAADGIDDVGFLVALVDEVAARLCIDRERVYAAGMSNGGFMTYRLACEAADVFAGFAPVAGGLAVTGCTPSRPVPLIAYHGLDDSMVPYSMGDGSFREYALLSGCTGDPVRTMYDDSYCDIYETCDGGIRVGLCSLVGMDHCWPGGEAARRICETFIGSYSADLNANEHMWEFFGG